MIPETVTSALPVEGSVGGAGSGPDGCRHGHSKRFYQHLIDSSQGGLVGCWVVFFFFFQLNS